MTDQITMDPAAPSADEVAGRAAKMDHIVERIAQDPQLPTAWHPGRPSRRP